MSEQVNVPSDTALTATVGGPEMVTLYAADGGSIRVHAADAERLLARGFSRQTFDRKAAKKEAAAAVRALRETIEQVTGVDDEADILALGVALDHAANAVSYLIDGIDRQNTRPGSEPVTLVDPSGVAHQIDPGQVAHYTAKGYTEGPHG